MKYNDAQQQLQQQRPSQSHAFVNNTYSSAFKPSRPQVNNYVSIFPGVEPQLTSQMAQQKTGVKRPRRDGERAQMIANNSSLNITASTSGHWNVSTIVTSADDEKPTDFSQRYQEQVDDVSREDEPVNYSQLYREPGEDDQRAPAAVTNASTGAAGAQAVSTAASYQQHVSTMDDD